MQKGKSSTWRILILILLQMGREKQSGRIEDECDDFSVRLDAWISMEMKM